MLLLWQFKTQATTMPNLAKGFKGSRYNLNEVWNIEKRGCPVTLGTMRLDATKSKEKGLFVSLDLTPCFIIPYQNIGL